MEKKNIDFEFQDKIRQYVNSLFEKIGYDDLIVNKLSNSLREELLLKANGPLLQSIPFLRKYSKTTIKKIIFALKKVVFHPEEIIYKVTNIPYLFVFI